MNVLIAVCTYNRPDQVQNNVIPISMFCRETKGFNFVLSIDGSDQKIIEICKKYNINHIYSNLSEGVGISKNRVFKSFPDFDYYFFIEDDAELLDNKVFINHINAFFETGIHHFSLHEEWRIRKIIKEAKHEKFTIIHAKYGSAQFNFFTREGLMKVGGWHTKFAKYCRFGHTEHSYRFYANQLCPAPFNIIKEYLPSFTWYEQPPQRKLSIKGFKRKLLHKILLKTENHIVKIEQDLIDEKLNYFPFSTPSSFKVIQY